MNWVGGVRNRIKLKQQKRQQKEFFEKRKLKSKFKLLGPPLSPQQNSSVSWDLLTLHIVNRIAAKKEHNDVPNKIIQVDMKKDTKMPIRRHNIELPMSPCSTPSRISLEESQCSPQEKKWSSRRKHFANTRNLKYGELSPVMESNSLEYNVVNSSCSSMDRFNGYPLSDSWISAKSYPLQENLSIEATTAWDSSYDNQEHLQQHFLIQDGISSLNEPIEHTIVHTDHEKIVPSCRSLPKHSNARLLQSSLMESSGIHSNNGEEYVSFAVQDTFPLPQKVTTQLATTNQSMTFYGTEFPLTQCFNSENSQPIASYICQEKFMHNPLAPAETGFKIDAPYKRSDMYRPSLVDQKSVTQDRKSVNIFTQPKNNLFKEAIEKDHFGENNSHDQQFLESNLEEFNVQENNGFFRGFGETWRPLDYRGTGWYYEIPFYMLFI
ncbi:uncharacterized protein [Heptranchias perlo]|uniref:uncharacterized protein n=1 Tax=Heptranchias perlo TaxID=212740 RepID=UPI0035597EF0